MTLHREFVEYLTNPESQPPLALLDKLTLVSQVYDVIGIFDINGRLLATNRIDRNAKADTILELNSQELESIWGQNLLDYTPDSEWLFSVRSGHMGTIDWHMSPLVHKLYRYLNRDISNQYSIGFAAPVFDEKYVVVGGVMALMNWEYIQEILDKVEDDLKDRSLGSGYAFLFESDANTIIGHKYRRNREYPPREVEDAAAVDNYGTRLAEDHRLGDLRDAALRGEKYFQYEYPAGTSKISGLARVNDDYFHWICGVGIDNRDIFGAVQDLKTILIAAASVVAFLVVGLTFWVARNITTPLKRLTQSTQIVSSGDFSQRVEITGGDEIGNLAKTFNEMAISLQERSQALIDLNRRLEEKVLERTAELETANKEMEKAYNELKETQFQLVQSEKMASLGQLVAGIAHEIKNPLNFIYGNTDFLRGYIQQLEELISQLETRGEFTDQDHDFLHQYKEDINYDFLVADLETLIKNFEEGAKRIHTIITDLRTFSRMESDDFREIDIHEPIELALSLLQNEYRDRIVIEKNYGDIPKVECHAGKINQVFMNLLLNACQAIPGKGKITITSQYADGELELIVEDDGIGMEAKEMERIFEPFYTTKPVGSGTGLGLSISYAVIQQHNGSIRVESEKGKGTRFIIRMPVKHD
jgi:signal transduction histidine kinase